MRVNRRNESMFIMSLFDPRVEIFPAYKSLYKNIEAHIRSAIKWPFRGSAAPE